MPDITVMIRDYLKTKKQVEEQQKQKGSNDQQEKQVHESNSDNTTLLSKVIDEELTKDSNIQIGNQMSKPADVAEIEEYEEEVLQDKPKPASTMNEQEEEYKKMDDTTANTDSLPEQGFVKRAIQKIEGGNRGQSRIK